MQHKCRQLIRLATAAASICLLATVAIDLRAEPATSPATQPAATQMAALTIGPMAYFDQNCARCHGQYGSFYGSEFGKGLTDSKLHDVVRDMAEGPGNAPLADADLAAEIAYHRSMIKRTPFIAITKSDTTELSGEVTAGATVTLTNAGKTIEAKVDEHSFTIKLDGPLATDASVAAKIADKTTKLSIKDQYTHRDKID